ncbi:nitroreductase [Amycolatopsis sp. NPDC051372]|uniref:nitroreductase n=1 Tax=Amycolatopsis sp. NPDC051372 TaxID=3155669 RepID=UPI0034488EC6
MNDTTTTKLAAPAGPAKSAATVVEALLTRRSVRAFLPTPVPRAEVERLLALASRSASNSNSQPWHVHVLTGEPKLRLTEALWQALDGEGRVAETEYPFQPPPEEWEEPFRSRRQTFGEGLYRDTLGIEAHDAEGRLAHHRRNYDFFGAPVGLVLTVSRSPLAGALIDAGLFLQALMLLARQAGLDTCPQASFIDFYPVLRQHLKIPDDQIIVCGLALGHADPDHRLSRHRTARAPVDTFTTFHSGETV